MEEVSTKKRKNEMEEESRIFTNVIIEPFYGGSHKQLIDILFQDLLSSNDTLLLTLSPKKWKWRARCSSLYFSEKIPTMPPGGTLFCSSMLNLSELLALRPDLHSLHKVVYFHENQLCYPARHEKERDFQFSWNQILSCLVADQILFNSHFNMSSFLAEIDKSMKNLFPSDQLLPTGTTSQKIQSKSQVLYFPIKTFVSLPSVIKNGPIHIVWNHRWEYDKRPDLFFNALYKLKEANVEFSLSVIGEKFAEVPEVFSEAQVKLSGHIKKWGFLPSRGDYFSTLKEADIIVSTTDHEFFGVSVIEGISMGCYPLCPKRVVFPEYLPEDFLYNTDDQLVKKLRYFARYPEKLRNLKWNIDLSRFQWENLKEKYAQVFKIKS